MKNIIVEGHLTFNVEDITNKHILQSEWKRVGMVLLNFDICEYYAWFIRRRYNLTLYTPLRGGHVSFINDSIRDINGGRDSIEYRQELWESLSKKYEGAKVKIVLNPDVRTNGTHWWLNIPEEDRVELHNIRAEIGLNRPNFGLHMSIGRPNDKNIEYSHYLHERVKDKNLPWL